MDNQYEDEINLVTLLFKAFQKWRSLLIVAVVAAVAVGGTKLAINIQGLIDPEEVEKKTTQHRDLLGLYEAEGEALERRLADNQRNLVLQIDYNEKSMLMKVDPRNEWVGSVNLYIDTGYQILPGTSIQPENPAYKITYAYNDYYSSEFYTDVMGKLTFDIGELKYLKEVLGASVDANRQSISIGATADTKEHCDEMIRLATEAFQSRYDFVKASLGDHTLTSSTPVSYAQINASREQYQVDQEAREKILTENIYSINEEYREWEKKEDDLKLPIIDWGHAIRNGIKWMLLAGVLGGFVGVAVLFVKYMFSGRIKSAEDLGRGMFVLAELPVRGQKKSKIDRLVYRIFGVAVKESEYDGRVEAMALSLDKMLKGRGLEKGTIAFVGDVRENAVRALVKQVGQMLPDAYKAVAAGNITLEPAAAKAAYDADAIVLVAEQDVTMKKAYEQICGKLEACKLKVMGAVLFGVECV